MTDQLSAIIDKCCPHAIGVFHYVRKHLPFTFSHQVPISTPVKVKTLLFMNLLYLTKT